MQPSLGIAALVPRRLWSGDHRQDVRVCRGTMLFADIAGFTRLTEMAMRRSGTRGIEQLTSHINAVFSDLVDASHQSGGDILKFGGDAILVAFDSHGYEQAALLAAIDSASAMERAMVRHRRTTLRGLSLHLGLAHGAWYEFVAGIPGTRREHFVWGDAITRAMHAADSGGSQARLDCVASMLPTNCGVRFKRVSRSLVEFQVDTGPCRSPLSIPDQLPVWDTTLWDFVAEGLRDEEKISAFEPERSAEHRSVTTLFGFWTCRRGLRDPAQSADLLEQIFQVVHKTALASNGLWARSDPSGDKQKLLLLFGATQASPEDVDRGLIAARTLQMGFKELRRNHPSLRLGVGVATATVFTGFVGHALRREFTAMGDGVNLAARLAAKSSRRTTLVDGATRRDSSRFLFRSEGALQLKNVRKPTAVYAPIGEAGVSVADQHNSLVEHPDAMRECLSLWGRGATHILLNARPGTNPRKFAAQLLAQLNAGEVQQHILTFDPSDASHPLGGMRRLCCIITSAADSHSTHQLPGALMEMMDQDGKWAARTLARLGPEAAASAVVMEIKRSTLTHSHIVLDHVEALGEFDRSVLSSLMSTPDGPRWLAIAHAETLLAEPGELQSTVQLGPLNRNQLKSMIEDMLAPARVSKSLLDFLLIRSHGMPRLACSLVTHLIAQRAATRTNGHPPVWQLRHTDNLEIPNGLRAEYLQHIDRLSQLDRSVVRAVAVLGEAAPLDAIQALCSDVTLANLNACLARLQTSGLVTLQSHDNLVRIAIADPTCRQAVYESMSHHLRESWHRQAAKFWQSRSRSDSARIGEHLYRARDAQSAHWLRRAAVQARRFWSLDRSLRFTRWAILALSGRCEPECAAICPPMPKALSKQHELLYSNLAEILQLQGQHSESGRVKRWLAQHATRQGDKSRACRYRISAAKMELLAGRYQQSQRQALAVLAQSRRLHDNRLAAQANYLLGETYRRSGRVDRSLRALNLAEAITSQGADRLLHADVLNALGLLHWNCGRLDDARTCFVHSLRWLPRHGDPARRGQVANNLGILTEELGHLRVAERYYHRAFTVFDRAGVRRHRAYSLGNLANLYRHGARYERAREAYEEVESELRVMGESHAAAYTVGNIGDLERDFGDWESARKRYEATLDFARTAGDEELKAECYARIAQLHLLAGRLDLMPRALKNSDRAATLAASQEFSIYSQILTGELEIEKKCTIAARHRIESAGAAARQVGLVYYQLWSEHALARLDLVSSHYPSAAKRCRSGMSQAHACGYTWWELCFATLGMDACMRSNFRDQSRLRRGRLLTEIEAGIGDDAVRARFPSLPIVREGHTQTSMHV